MGYDDRIYMCVKRRRKAKRFMKVERNSSSVTNIGRVIYCFIFSDKATS